LQDASADGTVFCSIGGVPRGALAHLQVAVDDLVLVEVLDGARHLADDAAGVLLREAALLDNGRGKSFSGWHSIGNIYGVECRLRQACKAKGAGSYLIHNAVEQLAALNVLHDKIQLIRCIKDVKYLHNVGMLDAPRDIDLRPEFLNLKIFAIALIKSKHEPFLHASLHQKNMQTLIQQCVLLDSGRVLLKIPQSRSFLPCLGRAPYR
jgi:hypothetical protein